MKTANVIKSTFRKAGVNVTVTTKHVNAVNNDQKGLSILYYSGGLQKFTNTLRIHYPSAQVSEAGISAFFPTTDFS